MAQKVNLHDLTESALVTASLHVASLSLLGRWVVNNGMGASLLSTMVWEPPLSSWKDASSSSSPLGGNISSRTGSSSFPCFYFSSPIFVDFEVRRKCQRSSFHSTQHQYQCINAPCSAIPRNIIQHHAIPTIQYHFMSELLALFTER